jgi:membrane fusion protein (multidrug efflux system)
MARYDKMRAPSTRKRMFWMLVAAVVVFGGVFAVKAMMSAGMNQFFDNMPQPAVAVSATTAKEARWADVQDAVGTFNAINGTEVTTEAGGVIRTINFKAGDRVRAGTVLATLNSASELATLKALETQAQLAVVQRNRWHELGKEKLVSKMEVDQRAADAAASIAQAEAQRALIAQKTIRAPFDGVLGIRKVSLGQYVAPGDPIVSLQALDPIYLDFSLPEQYLPKMREGTTVSASVDALPGKTFEGQVTAVAPQVDAATRNFVVQATFDNPEHALRPGTFAKVSFDLGEAERVVVIPQTAVSFNPYGNAVFVVSKARRGEGETDMAGKPLTGDKLVVKQRFIQTGATRGDLIAVTDGLKVGEQVVTSGLLKLRNDAEVTINNKVQPVAQARPAPENR